MSLYLIILLVTLAVPLLLSFDKKLHFYRQWKFVLPSVFIISLFYIAGDIYMTHQGVWGFDPHYRSDITIFGLPVEECLFFVIIPYASIFLHEAFILYFPGIRTGNRATRIILAALIISMVLLIMFNRHKAYTAYSFLLTLFALLLAIFDRSEILSKFYITFLLILIPFFIVNGILTGSFIDGEVVWYNNHENLGIRIFTIPVEDISYGFSLILLNLLLIARLKKWFARPQAEKA